MNVSNGKGGNGEGVGNFRFQNTLDDGEGLTGRDICSQELGGFRFDRKSELVKEGFEIEGHGEWDAKVLVWVVRREDRDAACSI